MADPEKTLSTAYGAVFFVGGVSLIAGLIAILFDVRFLQGLGLGWTSVLFGIIFLVLGHYTKRGSMIALAGAVGLYSIDAIIFLSDIIRIKGTPAASGIVFRLVMIWLMSRGFGAIRELNMPSGIPAVPAMQSASSPRSVSSSAPSGSLAMPTSAGPKSVSFVAPAAPQADTVRRDMPSKSLTPEILNLRFAAYRCEIANDHFKAIYQNASQKELKWFEVSALVIRQLPFQAPWEGKVILDIVPMIVAGEKVQPVRVLSSTFVNYGFMPQGQSASTKENIRRLANFIVSQNRSIYIDPGTDSFVQAGQPPVRFLSMSQFTEYDSRYG